IPTVIIFSLISAHIKAKKHAATNGEAKTKVNIFGLLPWFILAFVGVAIINSFGLIPSAVSSTLKDISKFLMVAALAAIGMNTDFKEMKKSGINPMIHGFIISALVVVVALAVEYFLGLV
ncbi:MAG: putative sulfate exporter family transporter, partial [Lachnospiraceae bacterium]|nr:putative sulfate exporter family transporter [Lachnospiraceae bacterium]